MEDLLSTNICIGFSYFNFNSWNKVSNHRHCEIAFAAAMYSALEEDNVW